MDRQKRHIVVVDDDVLIRTLLSDILSSANYKVTAYSSGQALLQNIRQLEPPADVIVLDRIMPKMSGLEALNKLCTIPEARNIPVIMLTSEANQNHVEKAHAYGVFDFIFKPIDTAQLLNALQEAIAESTQYVFE